jgi:HEAT repeats
LKVSVDDGPYGMPRFFAAWCVGLALTAVAIWPDRGLAVVAPHLRELTKAARLVVVADVESVAPYDQGRVAVANLRIETVLKGSLGAETGPVRVVERRDLPTPPTFRQGQAIVAFLKAAPRSSSLNAVLPPGPYYALVDLEEACLVADSPDSLAEMRRIVDLIVAESRNPISDATQRGVAARQLAFDLLSARPPVLVEDGAASLTSVPHLAGTMTKSELQTLEAALQREDVPVRIRLALVRAVGDAGLREAIPALQALGSPPEVMAAAWQALDRLQAAPPLEKLEERLAAQNPQVRAAAVRELLRREGAAAVSKAAPVALQDPDPDVRMAAIEALGETGKAEALPPLERVFVEEDVDLQQAAARAIIAIGGEPAKDAFGRLTFTGPISAQRYAFVCLMMVGVNRDDPLVKRIAETHPDETIRRLATHGVDVHKH